MCCRSDAPVPSPARSATVSTARSVVSSRCRACSTRCWVSQRARRQPGLRAEPPGERAHAHPRVLGERRPGRAGRRSLLQRPRPGRRRALACRGRARAGRCTATGRPRATAAPRSSARPGWRPRCRGRARMTCRHRSTPAPSPAEVSTSPSSTKSTFSLSNTFGYSSRNSSACAQCVVAGRPSSRPAAPSTNAPVQIDMIRGLCGIVARAAAISAGQRAVPARPGDAGCPG